MSTREVRLRKIGETMRIYRDASGRALDVIANAVGVSVDRLKLAEKGKVELTFVQYLAISEMYGVGFSNLFENGDGYFNPPHIPLEICDYLKHKLDDYCHEKHKTKTQVRIDLGMSSSSFHYFFRGASTFLSPQTVENVIALFNLNSSILRSVCEANTESKVVNNERIKPKIGDQDIQDDFDYVKNAVIIDQVNKKPDERNATMDALTTVTDALFFYKKRNEMIAELEKIVKTANALLEEIRP